MDKKLKFIMMIDGIKSVVELHKPMTKEEMILELEKESVYDNIADLYPAECDDIE